MPQMAPMNWTLLFTMMVFMYLIVKTLIYFTFIPTNTFFSLPINKETNSAPINKMEWKW